MSDGPYFKCPVCAEPINDTDPGVVYAVELEDLVAMGGRRTPVEGMGAYFHPGCWRGDSRYWRQKPLPR